MIPLTCCDPFPTFGGGGATVPPVLRIFRAPATDFPLLTTEPPDVVSYATVISALGKSWQTADGEGRGARLHPSGAGGTGTQ